VVVALAPAASMVAYALSASPDATAVEYGL
jgi:hypothetical protein